MDSTNTRQGFSVEDIRRIRNEDDIRRRGMNARELSEDIRKSAEEGYRILAQLRQNQSGTWQGES